MLLPNYCLLLSRYGTLRSKLSGFEQTMARGDDPARGTGAWLLAKGSADNMALFLLYAAHSGVLGKRSRRGLAMAGEGCRGPPLRCPRGAMALFPLHAALPMAAAALPRAAAALPMAAAALPRAAAVLPRATAALPRVAWVGTGCRR